ncbi:MAG TPA: hypothetical protein V6D12_13340 [Candidatus Obscuribacterales bacterium]
MPRVKPVYEVCPLVVGIGWTSFNYALISNYAKAIATTFKPKA